MVKHYFDDEKLFGKLKEFYDDQHYRFEIPESEFTWIRDFLSEHDYALVPGEKLRPFVVVVETNKEHPEDIFRQSVLHRSDAEYNFFLLKDRAAVEQATHQGATPLAETNFALPF